MKPYFIQISFWDKDEIKRFIFNSHDINLIEILESIKKQFPQEYEEKIIKTGKHRR